MGSNVEHESTHGAILVSAAKPFRAEAAAFMPDGKCPKIEIVVWIDSTLFVAGGVLNGRMELTCSSATRVRLAQISVHLTGVEQIIDAALLSSQTFMSSEIVYQGTRRPPTDAVHGPAVDGYYLAKKVNRRPLI